MSTILVEKLKNRDIKMFETFVLEYEKRIYSYAYGFTSNNEDALDITQDVFLKVYKNIDKFKENSSLSTWVYRITANVCIDFVRKNKKVTYESEEIINSIEDTTKKPEDIILNKELSEEILKAFELVDYDAKQAIVLRDMLGLSYSEIADILKIEQGTVKSRISRSRKKLREKILDLRNKSEINSSKKVKK